RPRHRRRWGVDGEHLVTALGAGERVRAVLLPSGRPLVLQTLQHRLVRYARSARRSGYVDAPLGLGRRGHRTALLVGHASESYAVRCDGSSWFRSSHSGSRMNRITGSRTSSPLLAVDSPIRAYSSCTRLSRNHSPIITNTSVPAHGCTEYPPSGDGVPVATVSSSAIASSTGWHSCVSPQFAARTPLTAASPPWRRWRSPTTSWVTPATTTFTIGMGT